jgi:hypothetical protein
MSVLPAQIDELYESQNGASKRPSGGDLISILTSLLGHFSNIYIVIDALDECHEDYRSDILSLISRLQAPSVHILIASRPYIEDIKANFPQFLG